MTTSYAHGKLLLTGEYFVLDGARSLAIPTRFGQRFHRAHHTDEQSLIWESFTSTGHCWLRARIRPGANVTAKLEIGTPEALKMLLRIIEAGVQLKPDLANKLGGRKVTTRLEFPRDWGLGSSSTLIWSLANWWGVDAFELLERTFGGSGYDLACAGAESPLVFWRTANGKPGWEPIEWSPAWAAATFFVHLNQKQNSREGIERYRGRAVDRGLVAEITACTAALQKTLLLAEARNILTEHEGLVADAIGLPTVGERLFPDFGGVVKSLGAWGGDFVWVLPESENAEVDAYFTEKGYPTVLGWEEMILSA